MSQYLGKMVKIKIDRPLGSLHPKHGFKYEVNYGYVPNTVSGDGEELDAYVLGVDEPLEEFTGKCVAIIHRLNDDDDKLVIIPENIENITDEEICAKTNFQEQFFKSEIVRRVKSLPLIVQNIVYRKRKDAVEVLLLKRTEERGGFWNVVSGTLELHESVIDCRKRELLEEAGIKEAISWSDEINRFSFTHNNKPIVVVAFAAKVPEDQEIVINDEHTEYRWVSFDEAIQMMKFDDDKKGLRACWDRLNGGEV